MSESDDSPPAASATDTSLARPNRFEIDISAIEHNARVIRGLVGPTPHIFAALKADAYGYGIGEVAQALLSSGVDALSLVSLLDAIKLRHHGINAPILLYAGVPPDLKMIDAVVRYDLMPTVLDLESAKAYSSSARNEVRAFVKVDVGLERLGIAPEDAVEFVNLIVALPKLKVQGLYAHMHVPKDSGVTRYLQWQFDRFTTTVRRVRDAGLEVPIAMTASTAVLEASPSHMNLSALDPGRVFYGLDQRGPGLAKAGLRPAFRSLKSRLIQVKPISRCEFRDIAPFPIRESMTMGVIPIGRYDGMHSLSCGEVLVRGVRVSILASPSIEHSRVDLTDVPDAKVGDEVVIIGRQGDNEISPEEVARQ